MLAAGRSTRYGSQKLLAGLGGEPLVRRTVRGVLDSGVDGVVVVTGSAAEGVRSALAGLPVGFVHNAAFADGMGRSIAAGVQSLPEKVDAAVIVPGDQPNAGALIGRLIDAWSEDGEPIVILEFEGVRVPPVLFAKSRFPELTRLTGDAGARSIVEADPSLVRIVTMEGPPPPDIDTPADRRAFES